MLSVVVFASLAALGAAEVQPWTAPDPTDSRGPCPMLNTLANHGYLPHNGRNLTLHHFGDAVVAALNTVPAYGTKPASMFIKGWGKEYFDLEDLNTPGILQHIGSLSRDDVTATEKHIGVVPDRVTALLADSPDDHLNATSIAKSRLRVEGISKPNKLTRKEQLLAYVESALVLMMMAEETVPSGFTFPSAKKWSAPKERVRVWLTEERLPEELGWKRSERQLRPEDLFPIMKAIYDQKSALNPEGGSWLSWAKALTGLSLFSGSKEEL